MKLLSLSFVALYSIGLLQLMLCDDNVADSDAKATPDSPAAELPSEFDDMSTEDVNKMRASASKFAFQAEVNRMMKLIINSLYRNKDIFLRELISNASDAIDKIRLLSLTNKEVLGDQASFNIQIKADSDRHLLTITDNGIGMTKNDLINNLGTIAKSGTADFLSKLQEASDKQQMSDLIGQFGVGFYSAFLIADKVIVTTKHNDDKQYIWESDSESYSIVEDPRGTTLGRGTSITLVLKEEAYDYLSQKSLVDLIKKYSQFINFNIYLWSSKTETVEEPIEEEDDDEEEKEKTGEEDEVVDEDAEADVEDESGEEKAPKMKKVEKTTWDWELINENKPIWTRNPADISEEEYHSFYKSMAKDTSNPLTSTHFVAEGEVTFKALLFVPAVLPSESFNRYGTSTDHIKLYVRRVFITDDFNDMLPSYLSFLRGLIDSDDLPLNVSRETLQQHKLLKVIKKKLVRKALDMFKKLDKDAYAAFWKEYSTNIKLGILEDKANKSRLAKLLRFLSSTGELTSLEEYVGRMKDKQEQIFFMAGRSKAEVEDSPFVERLLKRGYEVLYLTEAVDEYAVSNLPEFEGKKFQNVAKEGFSLDSSTSKKKDEHMKTLKERFEPLTKWLSEGVLKEHILRAELSERLEKSPCALITSRFGWTANMQRIVNSQTHAKTEDMQRDYYLNQKKALEINPRHPLIKELLRRVEDDPSDVKATEMATMMFNTAVLRSGYMLKDTSEFSDHIDAMMRETLGINKDETVDDEEEFDDVDDDEQVEDAEDMEDEEEEDAKDSKKKIADGVEISDDLDIEKMFAEAHDGDEDYDDDESSLQHDEL